MSLTLIAEPEEIELCGNEISVVLETDLPLSTANLQIQCILLMETSYGSGIFMPFTDKTLFPDENGKCKFFWDKQLWDSFERNYDSPVVNGASAFRCDHVVRKYKLAAHELSGTPQVITDQMYSGSLVTERFAYKGTITKMRRAIMPFFGSNGWNSSIPSIGGRDAAFMDWRGTESKTKTDQEEWLFWIYDYPFISTYGNVITAKLRVKYYRSDGYATEVTKHSQTVEKYEVFGFPVGFDQLSLSAYETANDKITKYETQVMVNYLGIWYRLSERKTWLVDREYHHQSIRLSYINSLGVMDNLNLNGSFKVSSNVGKEIAPTYWDNSIGLNQPEIGIHDITSKESFTVSTGNLTPNATKRLRELLASGRVFLYLLDYRVPIIVKTSKFTGDDLQNIFNYDIEFVHAADDSTIEMFL